jgi:hypothetical protein
MDLYGIIYYRDGKTSLLFLNSLKNRGKGDFGDE